MDFSEALNVVKRGRKIARSSWEESSGLCVVYQKSCLVDNLLPDSAMEITGKPHLLMKTADGSFNVWCPSQVDILSDDWIIVP
jgi:hypothetical protein